MNAQTPEAGSRVDAPAHTAAAASPASGSYAPTPPPGESGRGGVGDAKHRPTFLSLFSGIGGLDLGLERAGWSCVGQVEIDPYCNRVLAKHWPDVPRWADITEVDPHELPAADLVCGGFPCQDISVAGRRAGLAGTRSGLWWQFHRILAALRPRWVVIENVPGLLSSNDGRDMGAIIGALGDLGYGFAWRVLDAQHFGLAQRRRRVFVVGCAGDRAASAQVLFEPESRPGDPAAGRTQGAGVAASPTAGVAAARGVNTPGRRAEDDVNLVVGTLTQDGQRRAGSDHSIDTLLTYSTSSHSVPTSAEDIAASVTGSNGNPGIVGTLMAGSPTSYRTGPDEAAAGQLVVGALTGAVHGGADDNDAQAGHLIVHPITAREAKGPDSEVSNGNLITHALTAEGADASEDGSGRGTPLVAFDWQAGHGNDESFRGKSRQYIVRKGDYTGSLQENKRDAVLTANAVRRLTPTECERLQGFPDGWTAGQPDSTRYRQLGNAVAVPVAAWIGHRILEAAA